MSRRSPKSSSANRLSQINQDLEPGAIQLRTTATRTIERHAVNRTVNRQSSGAILAELKHRLSEIYDLTAAGSVLTWDEATYMPKGGAVARGRQSSLLRRLAHERFVDPALGRLIDRLEPGTDKLPADDASLIRIVRRDYERAIRVPAEYVARANAHGSASYNAWIWARPANDFAAMIPFLEKTLDLTTRVRVNHIGDALFSTLHEAGHAMYEQAIRSISVSHTRRERSYVAIAWPVTGEHLGS